MLVKKLLEEIEWLKANWEKRRLQIEEKILGFLKDHPNAAFRASEIFLKLHVPEEELKIFLEALDHLCEIGKIKVIKHPGNGFEYFYLTKN